MTRLLLALALALGVLARTAPAQQAAAPEALPPLQPGDRVAVVVHRNGDLTGTYEVAVDGGLLHPLYRQVQVAGLPIPEAEARVRTFLQRYEANPQFLFRPEYRVYVGGAVRDQNQHFLPPMTLGQAVVRAGGSTTPNRRFRVRLIRNGVSRAVALSDSEAGELLQEPIRPGDQILVEERPSFTRTYLGPTMQVIQTVTTLVSTYVFFRAIIGDDRDEPETEKNG
jgi:protein involved in polysaccharide export with SLBB domain